MVPAAGLFEDLDLAGPSSHYKEETLPLEPPDPRETRLCPTCGKTCSYLQLHSKAEQAHQGGAQRHHIPLQKVPQDLQDQV